MLILSRKRDQSVCFPELGITVQVLQVQGSSVRLGIDAPLEVRILRDELVNHSDRGPRPREHVIRLPSSCRHKLRNELHSLSLALHLYKGEMDAGKRQDAQATFEKLVEYLEQICSNEMLSGKGEVTETSPALTALLVDDVDNEREMLAGFLRMHGYQVATVADGLEAMEYLESHEKPGVVLIDMRMPRCDGPTTIRRIRDNPAFDEVKIFALSGSTPEENHLESETRMSGWFMKPLNPKSLVEALAITDPVAA